MAAIDPLALQTWAPVYEIGEPKSRGLPRACSGSAGLALQAAIQAALALRAPIVVIEGPMAWPLVAPIAQVERDRVRTADRTRCRSSLAALDRRPNNDENLDEKPIQMIFDFTMDLAELETADTA